MEKIRKVAALAERGIDGERVAAQERLKALLEKHNVTMDEVRGKPTPRRGFWDSPADSPFYENLREYMRQSSQFRTASQQREQQVREFQDWERLRRNPGLFASRLKRCPCCGHSPEAIFSGCFTLEILCPQCGLRISRAGLDADFVIKSVVQAWERRA
ncbi:MAG: DUF2786 domain-containing protein [Verrucomicrobiales bacterium]|nr:DUF2786 domain-containing protein [Verrucomicrobiales bacterium]